MRRLFQLILLSILLSALAGCSTLVATPTVAPPTAQAAQLAWEQVLAQHVNDRGEVDFEALARSPHDLELYVRHVADTPLDSLADGPVRLAHMINAYNALSMYNVVQSGIPATHAGLAKIRFFVQRKFDIGGKLLSLYEFENDVIRPTTRARNDPRVHFALNCSAVSCPVLPRRPFSAETLDTELERETRAFFALPQNHRIDPVARTVWLSELLDFYPQDFVPAPAPSLLAYANRYAPQPAPMDYQVRFTPYDWTVANSRRSR